MPAFALVDPWQPPYHRHAEFRAWDKDQIADLRDPKFGGLHLTLFLVVRRYLDLLIRILPSLFLQPSKLCDSDHPFIIEQAKALVPEGSTGREAADAIRAFVRNEIDYVLRPKDWRASQILEAGEGMCTNKAILQAALCRAVGVPAGFIITHLDKAVYLTDEDFDRDLFELIHQPTVHVFCAVWIPEEGAWRMYDATEPEVPEKPFRFQPQSLLPGGAPVAEAATSPGTGAAAGSYHGVTADLRSPGVDEVAVTHGGRLESIVELPATGETRYQARWLAGPFSPIQASLDSLLVRVAYRNDKTQALERQNETYRQHGETADQQDQQARGSAESGRVARIPTRSVRLQTPIRAQYSTGTLVAEGLISLGLLAVAFL